MCSYTSQILPRPGREHSEHKPWRSDPENLRGKGAASSPPRRVRQDRGAQSCPNSRSFFKRSRKLIF